VGWAGSEVAGMRGATGTADEWMGSREGKVTEGLKEGKDDKEATEEARSVGTLREGGVRTMLLLATGQWDDANLEYGENL